MTEVWLRANRRPLLLGMILPGVLCILGLLTALAWPAVWVRLPAAALAAVAAFIVAVFVWLSWRPLLAYRPGHLLVNMRPLETIRVPIEFVEGFLLGRDEVDFSRRRGVETTALVVRLADKAETWAKVDVHRALGRWCGGYLTIRGLWCEPLSVDFVQRLNARLAEVQSAARREAAAP